MSLLFRNRWIALLWLGMSLLSAAFFVSEGGGAQKLVDSADQITAQRRALQETPTTSLHVVEPEAGESTPPVLLPAGDLKADPNDPQPGDVFIEAVSGRRVQIVGAPSSAE